MFKGEGIVENKNDIKNRWGFSIVKAIAYVLLFSTIFILQNIRYPDEFRFISKHLDRIDFGREFYPEGSLLVIFLFLLVFLIFFKRKLTVYFSIKPLKKVNTYIWITSFLLLIFLLEHSSTGFKYIFQINIHPFYLTEYAILFLMTSIITPLEEELVFRSPLLFMFNNKFRYLWLIISISWFTLIHNDAIFALLFSIGLSFLTIKFKNLWVPIVAHLIWNLYALLVI